MCAAGRVTGVTQTPLLHTAPWRQNCPSRPAHTQSLDPLRAAAASGKSCTRELRPNRCQWEAVPRECAVGSWPLPGQRRTPWPGTAPARPSPPGQLHGNAAEPLPAGSWARQREPQARARCSRLDAVSTGNSDQNCCLNCSKNLKAAPSQHRRPLAKVVPL